MIIPYPSDDLMNKCSRGSSQKSRKMSDHYNPSTSMDNFFKLSKEGTDVIRKTDMINWFKV